MIDRSGRAGTSTVTRRVIHSNGLDFAVLEAGGHGPLALCLHGFPDTAYTWRYLLPELADAGFHAVAPFMRGYAPTDVPSDGCYTMGALIADAVALHDALGGDDQAVLIGSDWGAEAGYGAVAFAPERWRRLVTLGVPPFALDPVLFGDYEQLKLSFYLYFFRDSPERACAVVGADDLAFLDRLWQDWCPTYDPREHLAHVKQSLRGAANLAAAIGYYARSPAPGAPDEDGPYQLQELAVRRRPDRPTLYLHQPMTGASARTSYATPRLHSPPIRAS